MPHWINAHGNPGKGMEERMQETGEDQQPARIRQFMFTHSRSRYKDCLGFRVSALASIPLPNPPARQLRP